MVKRIKILVLLANVIAVAGSIPAIAADVVLAATQTSEEVRTSPKDDQVLPRNPNLFCGQFDNGLHYIIRKNANPPGKVFLNLAVRTGSLNETAEQNGLAHFLEHMAFKGSTHFAPTKLIPLLTHLGMQFGADTNAHTNQYETVFKLSMPDTKPETIALALTIFSDYASGLDLAPIQIESERRVILEEMRSRRGVELRLNKELDAKLYPGSQMAVHDVLGDPEIIKNAPSTLFSEYWNRWYRPENMTLVVVGDIDPDSVIAQAKPLLGGFAARAPASPPMRAGLKPFDHPQVVVLSDPEQLSCDVSLMNLKPVRPATTTIAQFRRELIEHINAWIVDRRFTDFVTSGKAPFRGAGLQMGDMLRDGFMVAAGASGEPRDWKEMLQDLIGQVHAAIDCGFSQHELDLAADSILSEAKWSVQTESSRDSSALVTSIASAVDKDRPMMSSSQQLTLLNQVLPTVSLSDLQQTFSDDFKSDNYAYVFKMSAPKSGGTLPTDQDVLTAADAAWRQTTTSPEAAKPSLTLLETEPVRGTIVSTTTDADLGLTTAVFANGVIVHHKSSNYRKDQVLVQITLPGGAIEETADNHGIGAVASLILERPATNRLSSTQIRDLFVGKNVDVGGEIGFDTLTMSVHGSVNDISTGLQLVNALMTDPKLEQIAFDEWKKNALQSLRGKPMSAPAQMTDALDATIYGNDTRFAALTPEIVQRLDRSAGEAWFKRIVDRSAVEVSIVGDISEDDAMAVVGKYLGSLPKRSGTFSDLDSLRQLKRSVGPYEKTVHYRNVEPKAVVLAGFLGCDELDPERRPLSLAGLILTDRLIRRTRFEQQMVYSINCKSTPGHGMPGTGMISSSTTTDPKNAEKLADTILGIMKDFAASGPSDDELQTAKKQIANALNSEIQDPGYWLAQTAEMEYRRRPIEDIKRVPAIYQTFSAAQVKDSVQKYAIDDRLIRMIVLPENFTPTSAPAAASSLPTGGMIPYGLSNDSRFSVGAKQ